VPLPPRLHDSDLIIYLHGFASSAASSKATYLGQRFREHGIPFETPDLNLPDFSTLTVTRMLGQVDALLDREPQKPAPQGGAAVSRPPKTTIIGSSLGGFVAVSAAAAWPERIDRLVLLAPALDFNRLQDLGGVRLDEWKRADRLMVFHYGYGRMMPVHYGLYEDARRYDAMHADPKMPVLVFQGRRDTSVDPRSVEAWSEQRPNVELHMLDDDHQLTASLPYIWDVTSRFLDISRRSDPAASSRAPNRE
jgi:uncharacterized protein